MSTSICQGLQSCLEPGLAEPRVLRLKLALPSPNLSRTTPWNSKPELEEQEQENYNINEFQEVKKKIKKENNDKENDNQDHKKNGLSFLQALTALTSKNDAGLENVYVHPMVKRSASKLSEKSLEMCTESLGSETGSDTGDKSGGIDDEMSLLSAAVAVQRSPIAREIRSPKRLNPNGSFPPPLTSVSGSAGFQVRPHREDGRLVLKAVAIASSTTCFHAERADGRLTLRLVKSFSPKNKEEEEEGGVDNEIESDQQDYEEEEEETEETEEVKWGENGGGEEMGAEKLQRPSRCKEDGHGKNNVLMNWEPFLVAT